MNVSRILRAGQRALRQGRFEEAVRRADELLRLKGSRVKALLLKALALHDLGQSEEALAVLRETGEVASNHHVPLLFQALLWYDLENWEEAMRAIGGARLLSDRDNFVVAGAERLILARNGSDEAPVRNFANCPSTYNEFVGPRILLLLEEKISERRDTLDLPATRWAKLLEDRPEPRPPSWRTRLPFLALRVPVLLLYGLFRRPTMPFRAEAAYLRGDVAEARRILIAAAHGAPTEHIAEALALLSLDMEEFSQCLNYLPPRGKEADPMREFVCGYANFHLRKWRKAERAFTDAAPQSMAHYFRGLCLVALGNRVEARQAFTREIYRDDLGIAERILIAGRVLGLFPGDATRAPFG